MEKIKWSDKVTNELVLERTGKNWLGFIFGTFLYIAQRLGH